MAPRMIYGHLRAGLFQNDFENRLRTISVLEAMVPLEARHTKHLSMDGKKPEGN